MNNASSWDDIVAKVCLFKYFGVEICDGRAVRPAFYRILFEFFKVLAASVECFKHVTQRKGVNTSYVCECAASWKRY